MRSIWAVAYNEIALTELALAYHVFAYPYADLPRHYEFHVCAGESGRLRARPGFELACDAGLEALRRADVVLIPAWRDVEAVPPKPLLDAIARAHRRGAEIVSICTGTFVVAAAGILDGRRATTHWMHVDQLRSRYPEIEVLAHALYVDDGEILTSAGTAAGIDLCLHIVRRDHGAELANEIGRRMIVPPHRNGGQQQYIETPVGSDPAPSPIGRATGFALEHLSEPLTVDVLAAQAKMSTRSFARHFRDTTGTTPLQWLLAQRILLARRLLEQNEYAVEQVGRRAGLGSPANFRTQFKRIVGTTPSAYRETFRTLTPR